MTLGDILRQDNDKLEEMVPKYASLLKTLHSTHSDNTIFGHAKDAYLRLARATSKYLTPEETDMMIQIAEGLPDGDCLVHCDAHTKNVMVQGDEMMFIDMAELSVGHPIYDLMSVSFILHIKNDEILRSVCGMDMQTLGKMMPVFLREYFNAQDDTEVKKLLQMIELLSVVRMTFILGMDNEAARTQGHHMIKGAREHLFPNLQRVFDVIQYFTKIL